MVQFLQQEINSINVVVFLAFLVLIGFIFTYLYKLYLYDYYDSYYDPKIDSLKSSLVEAIPEIKNIKISGSNKSFTINKKEIFLCLKDKNNNYYNDNMLIYVLLHEVAHVMCDEIGHTEKFKEIFRALLKRAESAGIYDSSRPPIDNYCNY